MDIPPNLQLSSGEALLGSYPVGSTLNPSITGSLYLTTQRLLLEWVPQAQRRMANRSCSIPLDQITQAETNGRSGDCPTLSLVAKAILAGTHHGQAVGDHDLRTDLGERALTFLAEGLQSASDSMRARHGIRTGPRPGPRYNAETQELRKKLRRDAFFDPSGHSMGLCFRQDGASEVRDLLCRLAILRQGGDPQTPMVNHPDASARLAQGEDLIWAYRSPALQGLSRFLKRPPSTLYLTNLRLLEECETKHGVRVRQVFPEAIRAIRWHASSSQSGALSVEPEGTALFRFDDARNVYANSLAATYDYFVDVDWQSVTSQLEGLGARLVALQQGFGSNVNFGQLSGAPVRLAEEENLRYSDSLRASQGMHLEVWLTSFRLIVRCTGHNMWAMCEIMIDPSVRVTCIPAGPGEGSLVVAWGEEALRRDQLKFVSPTLSGWNPYEALYRNLGVVPSRQLIAFGRPGPLIIPAPLSEASSLCERLTQELHGARAGTHQAEGSQVGWDLQPPVTTSQPPVQETERYDFHARVKPEEAVRSYPVRLGDVGGPAGELQITRSRVNIFNGAGGKAENLMWQASLPEIRQLLRMGSGDRVSTVFVTANPVLISGGRREKKTLGPLFDYTGRYPVVGMSAQAGRELGALWLELLERGEVGTASRTAAEGCPCLLAEQETLCQHYDFAPDGAVWLTTRRLILSKPQNGGMIWEIALSDLEGIEQWRVNGRAVDIPHAASVAAVSLPLVFSFPSLGSVVGAGLMAMEIYSVFKPRHFSYLVPVTGSSWLDRTEDSRGDITVGPPRPNVTNARDTEPFLWQMTIPVSGAGGERMWRELGARVAAVRTLGEHAVHDSNGPHSEKANLVDDLACMSGEEILGNWALSGPRKAPGYVGRVAVTDRRLVVQRRISAGGWSTETTWQNFISAQTRLETLGVHTLYGTRKGPFRRLGQALGVMLGLGVFFFPLLIVSAIGALIGYWLASPHSAGGPLGVTAVFLGIFAFLARVFSRAALRSSERSLEIPALTVLPRPWNRVRVLKGHLHGPEVRVRFGRGNFSSDRRIAEDSLRPFKFRWGIQKPYPPVPAAPLVPVAEDVGARVSVEVNQVLDRIRTGSA